MTRGGSVVEIDGTFNARDVGGHLNADGVRMRTGVVYRSASLDGVGPVGRADLQRLGVRLVADLRASVEIDRHGRFDPADSGITWRHLDSTFGPPSLSRNEMRQALGDRDPMVGLYRRMLDEGAEMFREGLALIAAGDELPMIVHCTSGKDRTGLFAAFVQLLCGVPVASVLADYERSALVKHRVHADMVDRYPELSEAGLEKMRLMAGVERHWMTGAFESFGDISGLPGWLASIGVSTEEQAAIRARFLD